MVAAADCLNAMLAAGKQPCTASGMDNCGQLTWAGRPPSGLNLRQFGRNWYGCTSAETLGEFFVATGATARQRPPGPDSSGR